MRPRGLRNANHGKGGTKLYGVWSSMHQRCSNPKAPHYDRYGGRGIDVCERWNSYVNFEADMGQSPGKGYSIDRIDNDGNYEPGNCKWSTQKEQLKNTSHCKLYNLNGKWFNKRELGEILGINHHSVERRMVRNKETIGVAIEHCLNYQRSKLARK